MEKSYEPSINEGVYPSDGGWTKDDNNSILLLHIPDFQDVINKTFLHYHYAWLYDQSLQAYIFCFKLDTNDERAIIFQKEHAGMLLVEKEASEPFQIVITDIPFSELDDDTESYLVLTDIELQRNENAEW